MQRTFVDQLKEDFVKQQLKNKAAYSEAWYVEHMSSVQISPLTIMNKGNIVPDVRFGKMYMYFYNPKHKDTLPYYDAFPLVLPVEPRDNGFLGLNFHYVDPYTRAVLLDQLRKGNYSDLYVTYNQHIKYNPLLRVCLKHYLYDYVLSSFIEIQPEEFEWVLYLPTEQFRKMSKISVWWQSRKHY